jgi:hypothetical protein
MYNLYEALQSGQSADAIAKAFTAELNAAIQKQEAEKKAAEAALNDKREWANELAEDITEFMAEHYPDLLSDGTTFTGADLIEMLDQTNKLSAELGKLAKVLFGETKAISVKKGDSVEDVFANFFKANHI